MLDVGERFLTNLAGDNPGAQILKKILQPMGEALLNSQLPDEFELYLIALQVVDDDKNEVKDFLVFPVNPNSIMHVQKSFTNVKKAFSSVHVNENNSFVPSPISLNGSFGRGIKAVITGDSALAIKTGYGVVRYLKNLIALSKSSNDNGKPYRTIFYNLAFNEVLTVEINECRYSQSLDSNRIWQYDLQMTAVAPGDIGNESLNFSLNQKMGFSFINKTLNSLLGGI